MQIQLQQSGFLLRNIKIYGICTNFHSKNCETKTVGEETYFFEIILVQRSMNVITVSNISHTTWSNHRDTLQIFLRLLDHHF